MGYNMLNQQSFNAFQIIHFIKIKHNSAIRLSSMVLIIKIHTIKYNFSKYNIHDF